MISPICCNKSRRMRATLVLAAIMLVFSTASLAHDPLAPDQHSHRDHAADDANTPSDVGAARDLIIAFRETGDDRNLDTAWRLLERALDSPAADSYMRVTAAFVAQSLHEFDRAEQLLNKALAMDSRNNEAWLLLASIHLVRGETNDADKSCRQLRGVEPLVLLTCRARVALARQNHEVALVRLSTVLQRIDSARTPPDVLAWSYSVAGDLAIADEQLQLAETMYRRSLVLTERTQVRAALVDVLLARADYEAAWQELNNGTNALPLLVRRMIVADQSGRRQEVDRDIVRVQSEFGDWIAAEDWLHAREMTRFYIDVVPRPALARRLAVINARLQKEPEDLRLLARTEQSSLNP